MGSGDGVCVGMEYFGMLLGGVPESGEGFEDNGRSHFVTFISIWVSFRRQNNICKEFNCLG